MSTKRLNLLIEEIAIRELIRRGHLQKTDISKLRQARDLVRGITGEKIRVVSNNRNWSASPLAITNLDSSKAGNRILKDFTQGYVPKAFLDKHNYKYKKNVDTDTHDAEVDVDDVEDVIDPTHLTDYAKEKKQEYLKKGSFVNWGKTPEEDSDTSKEAIRQGTLATYFHELGHHVAIHKKPSLAKLDPDSPRTSRDEMFRGEGKGWKEGGTVAKKVGLPIDTRKIRKLGLDSYNPRQTKQI